MFTQNSGIIFSDIFINNKDLFIEIFTEHYKNNQQEIDKILYNLNKILKQYETKTVTEKMSLEFNQLWKQFEQKVLLNQRDLELIVVYRGQSGKNGTFSQIIKQSMVEGHHGTGSYGIETGHELIQDSMKAIEASKIEKFLQSHLNGFLNQLERKIDFNEEKKLWKYHKEFLHKDFIENNYQLSTLKWREPFYGMNSAYYFGGQGLGQAYDAFMNHLANYNKQIYYYLSSSGRAEITELKIKTKHPSVYQEEGGAEKDGHFPQLLNESRNHTGWYTGGDIIIINPKTMDVVYNIQLKTTTIKKKSTFQIKVNKIRKFIAEIMKLTPEQKAERIFNFFLTSVSNRNDFNSLPQETIDKIIKENLSNKLSLNF